MKNLLPVALCAISSALLYAPARAQESPAPADSQGQVNPAVSAVDASVHADADELAGVDGEAGNAYAGFMYAGFT